MILNEIIDLLKDQIVSKNIKISGDTELKNIKDNSEKVEENDIFVAIKGSAVDGHDYINTAYKKGAALIILENNKKLIDLGDINYLRVKNSRKALADIAYNFPMLILTDLKLMPLRELTVNQQVFPCFTIFSGKLRKTAVFYQPLK